MSNGHLTRETVERLVRRELSPGELIDALRHVDSCPECAALTTQLAGASVRSVLSTEALDHLDYDTQLVPFVEQSLDAADLEIVESHLEDCAMCRAEAEDLRELNDTMSRKQQHAHWGWLAAAAAIAIFALLSFLAIRDRNVPPETPSVTTAIGRPQLPPVKTPPRAEPRYANADWERLVATAVSLRALTFPANLDELAPPSDELRGASATSAGAMHPAGIVVRELRPLFTWPSRENATYVVSVFAGDEEIARSKPLREARWTPLRDLRRAVTYIWQVQINTGESESTIPAPPTPAAMFRIASAADDAAIRLAAAQYPNDHLLQAVLLAHAGLRNDATQALARAKAAGDDRAANFK